jgi:hypothetical protein
LAASVVGGRGEEEEHKSIKIPESNKQSDKEQYSRSEEMAPRRLTHPSHLIIILL